MTCVYNNSRRTLSNMCVQRDISRETRRGADDGNVTCESVEKIATIAGRRRNERGFYTPAAVVASSKPRRGRFAKRFANKCFPTRVRLCRPRRKRKCIFTAFTGPIAYTRANGVITADEYTLCTTFNYRL